MYHSPLRHPNPRPSGWPAVMHLSYAPGVKRGGPDQETGTPDQETGTPDQERQAPAFQPFIRGSALSYNADPNASRDVLGHASSETTWRYARINIEMKRKAIESCKPDVPQGPPVWRKDQDLLAYLESLGKRRD